MRSAAMCVAGAATLLVAGCSDSLFSTPAARAALGVSYALLGDAAADDEAAFLKTDAVRVRVTGATVAIDTTVAFSPAGEARLQLQLDGAQAGAPYQVTVDLLTGGALLFHGAATTTVTPGAKNTAEVTILPVPAALVLPDSVPTLTSLGDTLTVPATLKFATGDVIDVAPITWTSSDTSIVTVDSNGRIFARQQGTAQVMATSGVLSAQLPVTVRQVPVRVAVGEGAADTTLAKLGETRRHAWALDARGFVISDLPVELSSSRPGVIAIEGSSYRGTYPGITHVTATAGALRDSTVLRVNTTGCPLSQRAAVGAFSLTRRWGYTDHVPTDGYEGLGMVFSGGLAFGTSPADLVLGINPNTGQTDFEVNGVCVLRDDTEFHAVTIARAMPDSATAPGLWAVEEVFAFSTAADDDYILLKYTFTNYGSAPISNLHVAGYYDFDLNYGAAPFMDIAQWNGALGIAETLKADSLDAPQMIALVAEGAPVAGWMWATNGPPHHAGSYETVFAYMSGGISAETQSTPRDIRQLLTIGPLTLNPGESRELWFALVPGQNRAHMEGNVAAARNRIAALSQ